MNHDPDEIARLRDQRERLQAIADAAEKRADDLARDLRAANDRTEEAHVMARESLRQRDATAVRERAYVAELARLRGILAAGRDGWLSATPDADAIRDHARNHPAPGLATDESPAGQWLFVRDGGALPGATVVRLLIERGEAFWETHSTVDADRGEIGCGKLASLNCDGVRWVPLTSRGEVVT